MVLMTGANITPLGKALDRLVAKAHEQAGLHRGDSALKFQVFLVQQALGQGLQVRLRAVFDTGLKVLQQRLSQRGWRLRRFLAAGDQGEQEKNGKQEGCNGFHTQYSFLIRAAPAKMFSAKTAP